MTQSAPIAGEVLLRRLKDNGVDYLFANGGTDFAPVIEGLVQARNAGADVPEALVIPHENAAVAMAHGYYQATGKAQAVMVHTNVGLANSIMGTLNAASEQVPMFIASGRTPVTETGHLGCRTAPINWGQDMRDQAGMIREAVKWDFELHYPDQAVDLVDRAMSVAMSAPRGPVYMSLPREALSAPLPDAPDMNKPTPAPARMAPHMADVEKAAEILIQAEKPLIISHHAGTSAEAFEEMRAFAEEFAISVVDFWPSRLAMSTDSPMHAGFSVTDDLKDADAVLVLDALVPWIPARQEMRPDCRVIHAGNDPLHARFPVRGHRADVALTGDIPTIIDALGGAMQPLLRGNEDRIAERGETVGERNKTRRESLKAQARDGAGRPMTAPWISHCVSEAAGRDAIIMTELGVDPSFMQLTQHDSLLSHAVAGGLGWCLPASLGVQLADRERLVVATMGDGSYMFANPTACHQIAEALNLPILAIVFNNGMWKAVQGATLDIFPDGDAAKANQMPVTSLEPAPDYCKIAEASRAYTERVEDGKDLPGALERAIKAIKEERRQALLDVAVGVGGAPAANR